MNPRRRRPPGSWISAPWRGLPLLIAAALLGCAARPHPPTPASVADLLVEAEADALAGHHTAAESHYRLALELAPDDPEIPLALAELYRRWQHPEEAVAALDLARQRGAAEDEVAARHLSLLLDARAWDEATTLAEELLTRDPTATVALDALTKAHLERGTCADALTTARRAVAAGSAYTETVTTLALLSGAYAELTDLAPSLALDPAACGNACDRTLGMRLVREQRWGLAACLLEQAVTAAPENAEVRIWYGEALARTGRAQAAYAQLRKGVEIDPELPQGWLLLGTLLLSTGDLQQARIALLNAHRLDPDSPAPCLAIAELKAQTGLYREVDTWAEAALERAVDDVAIAKAVARFYLVRGIGERSVGERAGELALRLAPDDGEALTLLGWGRLARGQVAPALEALDRAVAAEPARAEAHYWRARALLALGATARADAAFTRAADLGYRP